jgi:hypothetical protein
MTKEANGPFDMHKLIHEIIIIYSSDPVNFEKRIEDYLMTVLDQDDLDTRISRLNELFKHFESKADSESNTAKSERENISKLINLLLNNAVSRDEITDEVIQKLTDGLNSIFNSLNSLVKDIDCSLYGSEIVGMTIRGRIGSLIEGEENASIIESYLDRINESFFIAYDSFYAASRSIFEEILDEMEEALTTAKKQKRFLPSMTMSKQIDILIQRLSKYRNFLDENSDPSFKSVLYKRFEKECYKTFMRKGGER